MPVAPTALSARLFEERGSSFVQLGESRLVGLERFLLASCLFPQPTNHGLSALVFVSANGRRDSTDIKVVCLADGVSDSVQVVDDGITLFHVSVITGQIAA